MSMTRCCMIGIIHFFSSASNLRLSSQERQVLAMNRSNAGSTKFGCVDSATCMGTKNLTATWRSKRRRGHSPSVRASLAFAPRCESSDGYRPQRRAATSTPVDSCCKGRFAPTALRNFVVGVAILIFVVCVNTPAYCKPWGLGYILMHTITPCIIPALRALHMLRDPALQDYSWDVFWQQIDVAAVEWRDHWENRSLDLSEEFLVDF